MIILDAILAEVLNNRSIENISNEVVFIELFLNITIVKYNNKDGCRAINCQ